jgi:hypothetical protein
MVQSSKKLWVDILSDRYVAGSNILHATAHSSDSITWSSILRARNVLKDGFSWRVESCSSSFWSCPWSSLGFIRSLAPYIDIHDLQLSVKDVFSFVSPHAHILYTQLPSLAIDLINNMQLNFNASLEDTFIWTHSKNDIYTANSGYSWMLARMNPVITSNSPPSWSWIWKLQLPEKIKFLFWLACHNSVPTLSMLNHRNIAHYAMCSRCGLHDETFLHCVRDCTHCNHLWQHVGFNQAVFSPMKML